MGKKVVVVGAEQKAPNQNKMKIVKILTIFITLVTAAMVIGQLFMPALKVGELGAGGKYEWNTYSGIDTAFICWPAFILGGELIGPNVVLIAGIVLSILLGIIFGLLMLKSRPKKSTIYSGIFIFRNLLAECKQSCNEYSLCKI